MKNILIVKKVKYFFLFILTVGIIISFATKIILSKSLYQSGSETIGLFIPPFLCTLFMYFAGKEYQFNKKTLAVSLLLLLLLNLPFGNLLLKQIKPNPGDDFDYYFKYAQNMITHKTLWGGDQIRFHKESKSYITQPGYRYFVALELMIFQKLYRFVSILNIALFITAFYLLLKTIHKKIKQTKLKLTLSAFLILSIPYATKNILMGLPEWLTIILIILFAWFYFVKQKPFIAFIILAFVPFLRQNLLPPVVITLFIHCLSEKIDYRIIVSFVFILLLPIYHNLYYAGELRYFTSIFKWPFLEYKTPTSIKFKLWHILNNLLHYTGFDVRKKHVDFIEEGFLMLIFFVIIYVTIRKYFEKKSLRFWFYVTTLLTLIIPTLLLATDFYPRFEFVVIYFTIVLFLQFKTIHTTDHPPYL